MNDYTTTNVTFRLYQIEKDLIQEAADKTGVTLSDYVRPIVRAQVEKDLNRKLPEFPPVKRGRAGSLVAQAAASLGMSRAEFEAKAAEHFAADTLGFYAETQRPAESPFVRAERPPERAPSGTMVRVGGRRTSR